MYASTLPRSNCLLRASIRLAWYRHMPASVKFETYFYVPFAVLGCILVLLLRSVVLLSVTVVTTGTYVCFNIGNEMENLVVKIQSLPNSPYCYQSNCQQEFCTTIENKWKLLPTLETDWKYTSYFILSDRHRYEIAYISPSQLLEVTKTSSNTVQIKLEAMASWLQAI